MRAGDASQVLAIYQVGLDTGDASFGTAAPAWDAFDQGRLPLHRHVAAAVTGEVLGWVAASAVSPRPVYWGFIEHSVYVHSDAQGQGIGAALLEAQALLRRSGRLRSVTTEVGDLMLDESATTAWRAGKPLDLTPTELQLLGYLLARRGRTVSKTELLTQVWGYGSYDPNLVEVRISSLRRKLEAAGPRIVHTVHGYGYTVRL